MLVENFPFNHVGLHWLVEHVSFKPMIILEQVAMRFIGWCICYND